MTERWLLRFEVECPTGETLEITVPYGFDVQPLDALEAVTPHEVPDSEARQAAREFVKMTGLRFTGAYRYTKDEATGDSESSFIKWEGKLGNGDATL